jgi:hypothetical protein
MSERSPSISSPPIRWSIITHAAEKLTSRCVAVHVVCKADQAAYRSTFTMVFAVHPSGALRLGTASHYSPEGIPQRALLLRRDLPHHIFDLGETLALAELA